MYSKEQLDALSGTKSYQNQPVGGQYFDTLTLSKEGKLYKSFYSQPKDTRQDPEEVSLPYSGIIVKIRRTLIAFQNGNPSLKSVEYDAGTEFILTTKGEMIEKQAKDMGAKVQLVLYVLDNGGITKLKVSGGGLYNPDDIDDMRLYNYLQSIEQEDSVYEHTTAINVKPSVHTDQDGFENTTYQLTFKSLGKHNNLEAVGAALTRLSEELPECDARDAKFLNYTPKQESVSVDANTSSAIDPNSVPF